jgi:1-acyl-sn-glycerol-3-phosphate acyltransferase
MGLPPRPVRRLVTAPLMVLLTVLLLGFLPLAVLVAAFAVRWLPGRWRGLRLLWFLLVYLVRESVALFALLFMWVLSGFGLRLSSDRFQRAHFLLVGWYLHGLLGSARRVMGLRVVSEGQPESLAVPDPFTRSAGSRARPVLVFSRHAGAGDSFLLVDLLVNTYGRRSRIVLKDLMQIDPAVDVVLNRLPTRFISTDPPPGAGTIESIADLAAGIEGDGALILFPEGGNFTEGRRRRAIARLEEAGLDELVPLAHELTQVLPPRPGGAFAAIDAAPGADVLFVAHTGLEQLSSPVELWRGLPMRREVRLAWWSVPAAEVPADHDARVRWLYEWWERIDTWIEQHRPEAVPAGPTIAPDPLPG